MADEQPRLYKIGEVCRLADVQPYVLRYWETEFPPLTPNKSGGGQRLYTQREIDIILRIKQLLYSEGFTIAGAKKKLDNELATPQGLATALEQDKPRTVVAGAVALPTRKQKETTTVLRKMRKELAAILELLDRS